MRNNINIGDSNSVIPTTFTKSNIHLTLVTFVVFNGAYYRSIFLLLYSARGVPQFCSTVTSQQTERLRVRSSCNQKQLGWAPASLQPLIG